MPDNNPGIVQLDRTDIDLIRSARILKHPNSHGTVAAGKTVGLLGLDHRRKCGYLATPVVVLKRLRIHCGRADEHLQHPTFASKYLGGYAEPTTEAELRIVQYGRHLAESIVILPQVPQHVGVVVLKVPLNRFAQNA